MKYRGVDQEKLSPNLRSLASGEQIIYEVIQLWNYRDKTKADLFESAIIKGVQAACDAQGLRLDGFPVFMPFRDSDEEDIELEDKGRSIFEEDIERLNRSTFGLIGFSDGLVKDAGAFFEYGRAVTLSLPTLLIVSDFFYFTNRYKDWSQYSKEAITYVVDPLVLAGLGKVVVRNELPLINETFLATSRDLNKQIRKKEQFRRRLEEGTRELLTAVQEETEQMCLNPSQYVNQDLLNCTKSRKPYVYLAMEGLYEWQIEKMKEITEALKKHGILAYGPIRHSPDVQQDYFIKYGANAAVQLGRHDFNLAFGAAAVVVDGEGWDIPIGPAFVQGLATAFLDSPSKKVKNLVDPVKLG